MLALSAALPAAAETNPPSIAWVEPAAGVIRGDVVLEADSSDEVAVATVRFLLSDGASAPVLLFEVSGPPYAAPWDSGSVPNGNYALIAEALDTSGNRASALRAVRVDTLPPDTTPPTANVASPADGAVLAGVVQIQGAAFDDREVVRVDLSVDGALVASASGSEIAYDWDTSGLVEGSAHALLLEAYDAAGNRGSRALQASIRDLSGPVVQIAGAADGGLASGVVTLDVGAADVIDVARIVLSIDGVLVATQDGAGPLRFDWNTDAGYTGADHVILAEAYDSSWNRGATSITVSVPDATAPTVGFASPRASESVAGSVVVEVLASDAVGVERMTLWIAGQQAAQVSGASTLTYVWNTSGLPEGGTRTLMAEAFDTAGNRGVSEIEVGLSDVTPPAVGIVSFGDGATLGGVVDIDVAASDAVGVNRLVLSIDGRDVATAAGVDALSFSWNTAGREGTSPTLVVEAYDAAWNRGRSEVQVHVPDAQPPALAVLGVVDGQSVSGSVDIELQGADAVGLARLLLRIDGVIAAEEAGAGSLLHSWQTSGLTEASTHVLEAEAHDTAGNVTTRVLTLSILDTTAPSVQIAGPAASGSANGIVTLDVSATDAVGVAHLLLWVDGAPVATEHGQDSLSFDWDTTAGEGGGHLIVVQAYDAAWNLGRTELHVYVPDIQSPNVAITTPWDGADVTGLVSIGVVSTDAVGIARLRLTVGGDVVADDTKTDQISYTWDSATAGEGSSVAIRADVWDSAGNTASQELSVEVRDVSDPVVEFVTPAPGAVSGDSVDVVVRATDATGIQHLLLSLDGTVVVSEPGASLISYSWNAGLEPHASDHTLVAEAWDNGGHHTTHSIDVSVADVVAPQVEIGRPSDAEAVSDLEIVGVTASDDKVVSRLALVIDGVVVHEVFGEDRFDWVWDTAVPGIGATAVVEAVAEDEAGNTSVASVSVPVVVDPGSQPTDTPLGIAPSTPDGNQSIVPDSFADARSWGADVLYWYFSWDELVSTPQSSQYLMAELQAGGATAVNLSLIHTTVLNRYPAPWVSFVEPGFAESFSDFAAQFAATHAPEYLFVGNEVNVYLSGHPTEVDELVEVVRLTREKVAAASPGTQVGVVVNWNHAVALGQDSLLVDLAAEADLIGYTVYGHVSVAGETRFVDPTVGIRMLEDLEAAVPGKPFAVVETGWNTSPSIGSDEQAQETFVRLLFDYLRESTAEFVSLFIYQDGTDCTARALRFYPPGGEPDATELGQVADLLCNLGLKRSDGSPKPAWNLRP